MPDFFVVGQPKSGTTALYEMLRAHPQVYMPALKEPMLMASDLLAGVRRQVVRARPQTLAQYLALFAEAGPQQQAGEASALYLCSRDAAANIARLQPTARIVAILREPASLLASLHMQLLQDHAETERDLRRALALEPRRREGLDVPAATPRPAALHYSEHVRYVEQLRRYHEVFAPEQVLVLIYDDFRADNEAVVRQVLRFLGLDDTLALARSQANASVRLRSSRLDEMVKGVSAGRGPVARLARVPLRVLPRELRRGAVRTAQRRLLYAQPKPPPEELVRELRERYEPEVRALADYLKRDLVSLWGYDRLR
ncbi:MAG TPA: sulfotransferase [Solirubrobacteraceae bacterium]|nr:sulfotransferase [Solirubrobacteraceae bacterium]